MDNQDAFEKWLNSQQYLPREIRDFHDQKSLFKFVDKTRLANVDRNNGSYMSGMNWVDSMVYTGDVFLWVMAQHGYTLQKSRKKFDFPDLKEALAREDEVRRQESAGVISKIWKRAKHG
ncbi:hypothetical protein ACFFGF_04955 [Asaia lannensis]|uniref:Uncharacterized protein n=1 Tax=Asaia lannensis NBRC 102526 TaxID=1307926 RepID=A0ABT1CIE9_9PROT|nr:hypothetical protein [Asaia lannensis]MCO6160638.1 hypothetical protein [Asaia lannensis NBRC 102526]GBR02136.1 hypothetical protein AA102526_2729 [Asaia lannensis NBRC 102526]